MRSFSIYFFGGGGGGGEGGEGRGRGGGFRLDRVFKTYASVAVRHCPRAALVLQ